MPGVGTTGRFHGARVHVLTGDEDHFRDYHLLWKLATHWRQFGIVLTTGPLETIPAELSAVICHWDRTRVNSAWLPANPHQVPLLNQGALDISKRAVSPFLLSKDSAWSGEVIVKTDLNCFGHAEHREYRWNLASRFRRKMSSVNWRLAKHLPQKAYPVLDSIENVPEWVWRNPDYVVEKFQPEREGTLYRTRFWVFFGNQGYQYRLTSESRIVKQREDAVRFEFLEGAPPEKLVKLRQDRGLDFGKIDFVIVDGEVMAFDVNKTPSSASPANAPHLAALSQGLFDFLR